MVAFGFPRGKTEPECTKDEPVPPGAHAALGGSANTTWTPRERGVAGAAPVDFRPASVSTFARAPARPMESARTGWTPTRTARAVRPGPPRRDHGRRPARRRRQRARGALGQMPV